MILVYLIIKYLFESFTVQQWVWDWKPQKKSITTEKERVSTDGMEHVCVYYIRVLLSLLYPIFDIYIFSHFIVVCFF